MQLFAFHLLPTTLLLSLATALQLPDFSPFLSALPNIFQDDTGLPQTLLNNTDIEQQHDLLRPRQTSNACPSGFKSCSNLGAPSLCCVNDSVCSADQAGMVACCPSRAVCTGTITGVMSSGTVNPNGVVVVGGAGATTVTSGVVSTTGASTTSFQYYTASTSTPSTTTNGFVSADSQSTVGSASGFIIAGTTTVATPAAGIKHAEVPAVIQAVLQLARYLPL